MKKIFLLIPLLFLTFGCVESELIIPGEIVGDVGDDVNPDTTPKLAQYDFMSTDYDYSYRFNDQGKLTNSMVMANAQTRTAAVSYTNDLVSAYTPGYYSAQDSYTWNDQGQLTEINAGSTPENKMTLTYAAGTITAVRTINGAEENTINFALDNAGYITGFNFTDQTSGNMYDMDLTVAANLLTSAVFSQDGNVVQQMVFTYDNQINPVFAQNVDHFNIKVLNEVYGFNAALPMFKMDSYALFRSVNNIAQIVAGGPESSLLNGTLDYAYEYNTTNYPVSATVTQDSAAFGNVAYTY